MKLSASSSFNAGDVSGFVRSLASGAVQGVQAVAEQMVETEQAYAPVDTGALRDSIQASVTVDEPERFEMVVGPSVDYSAYVEYGTGRRGAASPDAGPYAYDPEWAGMVPHPYVRPALDEVGPTASDTISASIKTAL